MKVDHGNDPAVVNARASQKDADAWNVAGQAVKSMAMAPGARK
jgi:hypothetical protein